MKNTYTWAASAAVLGSLLLAGTAFAAGPQGIYGPDNAGHWQGGQNVQEEGQWQGDEGAPVTMVRPAVVGSVTAISGDTLTVTSRAFGPQGPHASSTDQTSYTVNASGATVFKNNATSSVSAIAVGDMVLVQGSISGTSVTATTIRDGMFMIPGRGMGRGEGQEGHASSTPPFLPQGNGEPVVGGSVTAISGNTLTITNKSNVTYSVNTSNATVSVKGASSTVSAITVGDMVIVQGTVNGNSITASSIIDQSAQSTNGNEGNGVSAHGLGGVFGAIGGFFHNLFGFF